MQGSDRLGFAIILGGLGLIGGTYLMFRLFGDKKTFLGFAIIGFLLGNAGLGSIQQTAPSTANADQGNISDGELRAFVKAYVDNQKIRQKYEPTLENSTDPQKNREVQE